MIGRRLLPRDSPRRPRQRGLRGHPVHGLRPPGRDVAEHTRPQDAHVRHQPVVVHLPVRGPVVARAELDGDVVVHGAREMAVAEARGACQPVQAVEHPSRRRTDAEAFLLVLLGDLVISSVSVQLSAHLVAPPTGAANEGCRRNLVDDVRSSRTSWGGLECVPADRRAETPDAVPRLRGTLARGRSEQPGCSRGHVQRRACPGLLAPSGTPRRPRAGWRRQSARRGQASGSGPTRVTHARAALQPFAREPASSDHSDDASAPSGGGCTAGVGGDEGSRRGPVLASRPAACPSHHQAAGAITRRGRLLIPPRGW